jgi:2-polyprenyl-3-methyl-5-hydroxy-6-metoxy-1,4-benzoquinol methylase
MAHAQEVAAGERFEFGKNWARFLEGLTEERIARAEASLVRMLGADAFAGRSFLDIGSGSGLFSLAARRLGARVCSIDFDPHSVACALELRRRYFRDDRQWRIEEGSALDPAFLESLGRFDVVYSWGVLHHTGAMWRALENAAIPVAARGLLFVSIYNDNGAASRRWTAVKRLYCRVPRGAKFTLAAGTLVFGWWRRTFKDLLLLHPFRSWREYKQDRGMSPWRDVVDWVGGYPFEFAKPQELTDFYRARGFTLERLQNELRYRLGFPAAQPALGGPNPPGKFFFESAEAPALARSWAARSPASVAPVIGQAGQIARHRFSLLGYRDLDFGQPIDWQLDPVHGVRAPLIPWRRIPFLDVRAVGDHKIVWELSRHQHLVTLVRAFLFTGDQRWLDEAVAQWTDWQRRNPYPLGVNWCSTLEVAFRTLSWIWMEQFLGDSAPASFRKQLAAAIGHGAFYISRYLSTYFAPNTHLLGEAVALLFAGSLHPEFRDAARWRDLGWNLVLEQARAQVREDGFHFEQSVYYHVYALDFFLHARLLAARNGMKSPELDAVIDRMAAALHGISQTGQAPRFGDDDGGRLFDPSRNSSEYLLDPLAIAGFKAPGSEFTEEAWWLLGPEAAARFDQMPNQSPELQSKAYRASGYYALASEDALLVADAGQHGWGRGGHAHADALSVQLLVGRRAALSDPGTGVYPAQNALRDRLRATFAHSTLEIDGLSQADPAGSFAWSNHPHVTVERWHSGRAVDLFTASHDGYQRLSDPLLHRRWIVGWKPTGWLIRDLALGRGRHRFDLRWRLAPDGAPVAITPAEGLEWQTRKEETEFSPIYGEIIQAPVIHMSCEHDAPVEAATAVSIAESRLRLLHQSPSIYLWDNVSVWFARESGAQEALGWRTDAAFVLLAFDAAASPACFCLCEGTFFESGGQEVFRSAQPVDFIEWLPGDPAPAEHWNPAALTAPRLVPRG